MKKLQLIILGGFIAFLFLLFSFYLLLSPPKQFPIRSIVQIENGETLNNIAKRFKEDLLIRSTGIFQSLVIFLGGEKKVDAGGYFFEEPLSTPELARRVVNGYYNLPSIKVVFPEGLSIEEMSKVLEDKLPRFNKEEFLFLTESKEGFLFPDTYFFTPISTVKEVVQTLTNNFEEKILPFRDDIILSGRSFEDIIIMASIIEKEAGPYDNRNIISNIFWKRLDKNMLLQADATFSYINGKSSSQLTKEDLKIDSSYNTYKYLGLPPTPIANPGLKSIEASLYPEDSPYFYYLHGLDGNIYYAETHQEHLNNKNKYLK